MSELHSKMTALADAIRSKADLTAPLTIDAMTAAVTNLSIGSGTDTSDATAAPDHILDGKTAYTKEGKVTGTMINRGKFEKLVVPSDDNDSGAAGYYSSVKVTTATTNKTFTPTTERQEYNGYAEGAFLVNVVVAPIPAEYIVVTRKSLEVTPSKSEQVFNVINEGSDVFYDKVTVAPIPAEYITTTDATATEGTILNGETAYVNGQKITGKYMAPSPENVRAGIPFGYGSDYLPGIDGGELPQVGTFTEDATAEATDILPGKTAYVQGVKIEGSMPVKSAETYTPGTADITIKSGVFLSEDQIIKGDGDLTAENIRFCSTLFNVEGTFTADADAIASDIALGKTAYVKGLKVTGTGAGSAVIPYWYYDRSHLRTNCGPCVTYNVPIRGRGSDFKAFDGKLVWFRDGDAPVTADSTINWTFAAVSDYIGSLAIGDGQLYWAYIPESGEKRVEVSLLSTPEHGTVTQCMCLDWGVLFKAGGALYGGNMSGNTARAEYHQNSVNDPTGVVNIEKILNFRQSYTNFWVITDDGSLGSGWLDKDDFDSGGGSVRVSIDTPADGNPFVNYFSQWSEYDDGSIKTYEFAFRSDGLWYRQANGQRGNWSKAEDPGFRQTDWLGYCSMSGRAAYKGYNEATDMEEWEYFVYQPEVALHIDHDGRLWKISAAGEIASKDYDMVSVRLTGLQIEQVGEDSDWQCVPSVVSRGGSNLFGQKGGKVVRMWGSSSDTIDIGWEEYPVVLPGRMLCSEGTDLFFAPAGVTVDLSKAGGTY